MKKLTSWFRDRKTLIAELTEANEARAKLHGDLIMAEGRNASYVKVASSIVDGLRRQIADLEAENLAFGGVNKAEAGDR